VVLTPETNIKKEIIEYAQSIAVAIVLAAVIILFIAQTFVVRGESMESTLHDGERLIIEKVTYRFREPKRGDIVVVNTNTPEKYIKRVIGLPGDSIKIENNHVYVNGRQVSDGFTLEGTRDSDTGAWPKYKFPRHYL
jgi:signal peptidase I, bacterial type